ncbi:MAG: FliH/SctL family protein [Bacteroidota bacterium]
MSQVTVKLPRRVRKLEIVRNDEAIADYQYKRQMRNAREREAIAAEMDTLGRLDDQFREELAGYIARTEEERTRRREEERKRREEARRRPLDKPVFSEEFTFSDTNQPIVIDLGNVRDSTLSVKEAMEEVQLSYERGFTDGRDAAIADFEEEIQQRLAEIRQIDDVVASLRESFSGEMKKLEESIVPLSIMIAGHIIGREIEKDNHIVVEQVRKLFRSLEGEKVFSIYINPKDKEILESAKSELIVGSERLDQTALIEDESLPRGSCVMRTSAGTIDGRINSQLERLSNSLENAAEKMRDESEDIEENGD